jgi:hypothetical protein
MHLLGDQSPLRPSRSGALALGLLLLLRLAR